ncbi:TolC family protein [Tunturiibacter empetritectus]|uniref:TolC family protein n=1 Tax=Tunturiibacter empetritectus TaxID=3069691 RepID=UPI003D9AC87A
MKRTFPLNTIFAFGWVMALVIAPSPAEAWQTTTSGIAAPELPGPSQSAAPPIDAAATQANGGVAAQGVVQGANQAGQEITLDQALSLARTNEPAFAAAVAASKTAQLDRSIARAALLPSVVYHNQYLYTQPNGQTGSIGSQPAPRFIANNTVHEYISQGVVTETIGLAQYTALARAGAAAAIASAEMEISRRGLTSTVIGLFYNSTAAQERIVIQQRATNEAADFEKQTEQRETAREVAHADVIKAQLTLQQRQRDLGDAQLQAQKARLDLGVLLFPDPRSPYSVTLPAATPLPERACGGDAGGRE